MIYAELVSPYCWFREEEGLLLLPYPPGLKGKGAGLVIELTSPPKIRRVLSPHPDEVSRYIRTGRWSRETSFEEVELDKAGFEELLPFYRDLKRARKRVESPALDFLLAELAARALSKS